MLLNLEANQDESSKSYSETFIEFNVFDSFHSLPWTNNISFVRSTSTCEYTAVDYFGFRLDHYVSKISHCFGTLNALLPSKSFDDQFRKMKISLSPTLLISLMNTLLDATFGTKPYYNVVIQLNEKVEYLTIEDIPEIIQEKSRIIWGRLSQSVKILQDLMEYLPSYSADRKEIETILPGFQQRILKMNSLVQKSNKSLITQQPSFLFQSPEPRSTGFFERKGQFYEEIFFSKEINSFSSF